MGAEDEKEARTRKGTGQGTRIEGCCVENGGRSLDNLV